MKIIRRIGLLILFSLVGAILMYLYGSTSLDSSSVKWESLGTPPSKAITVVALGFVQTESGDTYQYIPNPGCMDNCWIKSDNLPSSFQHRLPLTQCRELPSLENYIDSKAICDYYGTGLSLTITAIDRNGVVYSWNEKFGGEGDSFIRLVSPYVGATLGLFVGLIVVFVDIFKSLQKEQ